MFEIGWSELLLIGIVMIIVIGPKELPVVMRNFGRWVARLRRSADDFRRQFEDSVREAGYEDFQRDLRAMRELNPASQIRDTIDDVVRQVGAPPALTPPASQPQTEWANPEPANKAGADADKPVPAGENDAPAAQPAPLNKAEPQDLPQPPTAPQKNGSAASF